MDTQTHTKPTTEEAPLEVRERRLAERRLNMLAAAVREHEAAQRRRPSTLRYPDLALYRQLRQISGGA